MSIIAVLASVFGVVAVRAARSATQNEKAAVAAGLAADQSAEQAAVSARLAAENERAAVDAGELAEQNAEAATVAADLARARELAASAISQTDKDPELATLLAVESIDRSPAGSGVFPEGMMSLREAVNANRLFDRLELPAVTGAQLLLDASAVVITEAERRRVSKYLIQDDVIVDDPVWVFEDKTTIDLMRGSLVHPNLGFVLVTIGKEKIAAAPGPEVMLVDGEDPFRSRLQLLDVDSGERLRTVEFDECEELSINRGKPWFSSDGSVLGVPLHATDCALDPNWIGFALLDTSTWTEIARWDFGAATMTQDMTTLLVDNFGGSAEILSFPALELQRTLDVDAGFGFRGISPDGRIVAVSPRGVEDLRPTFWDVETGLLLSRAESYEGFAGGIDFLPGGLVSLVSSENDGVWDPVTGKLLLSLAKSFSIDGSVSADGRLKATATPGVGVELWDIGLVRGGSVSLTNSDAGLIWLNPDGIDSGQTLALWGYTDFSDGDINQSVAVIDPQSGEVISSRRAGQEFGQLKDGRLVIVPIDETATTIGPLTIWDPGTDELTPIQDCAAPLDQYAPRDSSGDIGRFKGYLCPDGDLFFGGAAAVSVDGSMIAAIAYDVTTASPDPRDPVGSLELRTWDAESLDVIATVKVEVEGGLDQGALGAFGDSWVTVADSRGGGPVPTAIQVVDTGTGEVLARLEGRWGRGIEELSRDGSSLYLAGDDGLVSEFDTSTWQLVRSWPTGVFQARGLAVSPDGRLVAVGGEDDLIAIWQVDSDEPVLVDRIPTGAWASDVAWIDDDTIGAALMVSAGNTAWQTFALDASVVVANAREGLARGFTTDECNTYAIEPCRQN